ncbi:MAG: GGDEF domain-containing protein [Pseudomonadales bacterium]
MVTTVQNVNTIAFPTQRSATRRQRVTNVEQHTGIKLQLSNLLQTSLELHQVLQLFFDEVQSSVSLCSLSYRNEKINDNIKFGDIARHTCHYKLITNQVSLGELTFTRSKRFTETELLLLEVLIGCLICPIRNALMYREAVQSALRDPLTGTGNRLALENSLEREIALALRHNRPLSVLVIDIDKFKTVNDNYGHTAGDLVLKAVVKQLTQCSRETDSTYHTYRFGGEEFVILLNNSDATGSMIVAERIRNNVEKMTTHYDNHSIHVTVSAGIASLHAGDNVASLFERADKALYKAKHNGRNQTISAEAIITDPTESAETELTS